MYKNDLSIYQNLSTGSNIFVLKQSDFFAATITISVGINSNFELIAHKFIWKKFKHLYISWRHKNDLPRKDFTAKSTLQ